MNDVYVFQFLGICLLICAFVLILETVHAVLVWYKAKRKNK